MQTRNITFTGAGSTPVYKFMYSVNGVADSTTTISGNSISIPVSAAVAGDYTYTLTKVIDNNGCSQLQTSAATIAIKEVTASISGTTSVCFGTTAPEVTFTGSGWRASPPFTFTYRINVGPNLIAIANTENCISISAPTGVSGTFVYELLSVSGASGCSFPATGTATITVFPAPTITGTNSSCVNATGLTYTTEAGMTNYTWSLSGGAITSGVGTNSVTVNWGAQGAQSISVNYSNTYPCAAATPTIYTVYVGNMWIGNTSDWNSAANWCQGNVPTAIQDVVIPGSVALQPQIISAAAVSHDLILSGASASLQINAGQALTVNGNLTNNGTFTILSDALNNNGSLIVEGSGSGTGTIAYNRYLENNSRWFITSPSISTGFSYTGSFIGQVNGTYNFAPYNEGTNNWDYVNSIPPTLTPGMGYLVKLSSGNYVQYSGSLNGDLLLSLPSSTSYTGWNAIGNPYPSAIRIKDDAGYKGFLYQNRNTLDPNYQAIYLWNQDLGYTGSEQYYKVICNSGYLGKTYWGILSDLYVQAGQGFLVNIRYSAGTPGTIVFKKGTTTPNGMQVHSPVATTMKSAQATSWPGITLLATSNGHSRSTVVAFNSAMTTGLDPSYDAGLLSASDFNLYTHLVDGSSETNFTIQCLPDAMYDSLVVPVGIDLPQAGTLTFKADGVILPDGVYPVMEDRLLQISTALKTESDSLTVPIAEPSWGIGRFYLHFGGEAIHTEINSAVASPKLTALYSEHKIILYGTPEKGSQAWLYDINGRKLGGEYRLTSANRNEIPAAGIASGIYLLRIEGKTSRQTLKLTILNP
jgi:hypothetical protein